jgi:hypothetical protein
MTDSKQLGFRSKTESTAIVNIGSVHNRFAPGMKEAQRQSNLPQPQVYAGKIRTKKKARVYKGLHQNLVNRNFLLKCSKNAKKADDKAQCLS